MCGIVGYVGQRSAQEVLLAGLEKLEYRGYDSAGISVQSDGELDSIRAVGNLSALRAALEPGIPQGEAPLEALQPAGREIEAHRPAETVTWALIGIGVDRLDAIQARDVAARRVAGNAQLGRQRE